MNRHVNAIAGRLSLRPPQRASLEILDRVTEIVPPRKAADVEAALAAIRSEFPSVTNFEHDFPSLCFALATGVGKTRLMGAFVSYLHLAHGINNFFVLAPNLTIYNKLITDFTPNTPKYVFKGIAEFATDAPTIITGDNYEGMASTLFDITLRCKVNIFNIAKITSEVRGGKAPRIKRLSEYIGESYFAYLANLPDLVLIMDESHRYRASAGQRAINELKPVLGLELTATPFVETGRGPEPFKNVIFDYPLGRAMADGFVKEPAVVTRKDFNPAGMNSDEIERMKLEDGVRLHEKTKVQLKTYAIEAQRKTVKPFLLVIARDITHAKKLLDLVESDQFFAGAYKGKAIQVDSSKSGAEEEEMIERLLKVEHSDEPTEIVIHVNMLKEGWDVTNLYTIVPLRAANAKTLVEQSIGRGLRLPFGKRTGVLPLDTLSIVAHDRFQEIVDEANKPDSAIRVRTIVLTAEELEGKTVTVVSQPNLDYLLGANIEPAQQSIPGLEIPKPAYVNPQEQRIALIARKVIQKYENQPRKLPSLAFLSMPEIQDEIVAAVKEEFTPSQLTLEGVVEQPDFVAIVKQTTNLIQTQTINIPRILVVPTGLVQTGYHPFALKVDTLRFQEPVEEIWRQYLRTGQQESITLGPGGIEEKRLEDYVVSGLVDFDDVSYDDHADLLYDLAAQTVKHFQTYLSVDATRKVLRCHQREIARFIHAQMLEHFWEKPSGYETNVTAGFSELKPSAYTTAANQPVLNFRFSPEDKSNMAKYLFGGFEHCLYGSEKFQSDPERRLAVILERERFKWFRPRKGQFQLFYKSGSEHLEYQPDFVAEGLDNLFMFEVKRADQMEDDEVRAKREAGVKWCQLATEYAKSTGERQWAYALIPHDAIKDNMTIDGLLGRYRCT
jgi:type III restriction enzyme